MRAKSWILGLLALGMAALLAPQASAQREKLPPDDLDYVYKTWPNVQKTNTGIRYLIEKPGDGAKPVEGQKVAVLYVGKLLDGTQFDASQDPKTPFSFRIGREEVIKGWDQILPLMQVGEKRLVIIPSELAYGSRGQLPKIPRDATLVFEMELLKIVPDTPLPGVAK